MAIFFALITFLGWGIGDLFVTVASRRLGFLVSYFWGFLFGSIFIIGIMPFMGPLSDVNMFAVAIFLNVIHTIGNLSFFRGTQVGNASIVGTIVGAFSMVSVVLSLIFFKDNLSLLQITGIILAIIGVIVTSIRINSFKSISDIFSDRGAIYGLITMFCWGIYFAFVRIPAEKIGWYWAGLPLFLIAPFLLLDKSLRINAKKIFYDKKGFLAVIVYMILTLILADFSYNIGILYGYTSIVVPIAGASTVLYVILSRIVFREKLTSQQKIGIVSSLVGIILLAVVSG